MRLFFDYFKAKAGTAALCAGLCALFGLLGWLGGLEGNVLLYGLLLWAAAGALALAMGYARFLKRHKALERAKAGILFAQDALPQAANPLEADYQALLELVLQDRAALQSETDRRMSEMASYFALWTHQIKNPLAAMRLILQQGEEIDLGELEQELFETEQYVEMVLHFLRLDSETTDYVLQRYDLDELIRQVLRKYARQFIRRRIRLDYDGRPLMVLTDEKWLRFVIEQLISNSLKYTSRGWISITAWDNCLKIRDTGIGISRSDLPRVFEKGFTGYNGRADKKSTGIGLYLCSQVMDRLNHGISIASRPGQGTLVRLDLSRTAVNTDS